MNHANTNNRTLPLFERDSQLCECGHIGGQHGHENRDGQFVGIGLGGCQHEPEWEELHLGLDGPCNCMEFTPATSR